MPPPSGWPESPATAGAASGRALYRIARGSLANRGGPYRIGVYCRMSAGAQSKPGSPGGVDPAGSPCHPIPPLVFSLIVGRSFD